MPGPRNTARSSDRRHPSHRPQVEALEERRLLAGNVTTFPMGTLTSPGESTPTLQVAGDPLDNEILVKKGTAPGEIIVNGLNGTLVNGSTQEWHFNGVQSLAAFMNAGNDKVDLRNLTLAGAAAPIAGDSTAQVVVDGGQGDDRITMFNTTIDASSPPSDPDALIFPISEVGVVLSGETSQFGPTDGTGNDIIEVSNTTIIADGGDMTGSSLTIYGEQNQGGTITGGNDRISVTNTVVSATNTSSVGTTRAVVEVYGDFNSADATSVVGQGNDNISITNFSAGASGQLTTNMTDLRVFGDGDVSGSLAVTSSVGVGNDVISLTNDDIFASGNLNNVASVLVYGDDRTDGGETTTTVGQGDDNVTISDFALQASASSNMQVHTQKGRDVVDVRNSRVGNFSIDTGSGNDDLVVLNSRWTTGNFDLQDGNDLLKMNGNQFVLTDADGGLGIDTLQAGNNTGILVSVFFEIVS